MKSLDDLLAASKAYKIQSFCYETSDAPENSLVIKWDVAGASGGNCWGARARDIEPEDEPIEEFESKLLEAYKFLVGDRFRDEAEKNLFVSEGYYAAIEKENDDYEYYGNWKRYKYRYLEMKDVYELVYKFSRQARIDEILEDLKENGL